MSFIEAKSLGEIADWWAFAGHKKVDARFEVLLREATSLQVQSRELDQQVLQYFSMGSKELRDAALPTVISNCEELMGIYGLLTIACDDLKHEVNKLNLGFHLVESWCWHEEKIRECLEMLLNK